MLIIFALSRSIFAKDPREDKNDEIPEEQVDQIFAQWNKPDTPGCALAVIQDGKIIYKRGYGMAKLDSKVTITSATVFDIGSMSKQFTAAGIILLAESREISLDDDIRKYFPGLPDYGNIITIRHLIHHTSGIRDYTWLMLLARMSFENTGEDRSQKILDLIARQQHLYFNPGDDSYYSNSNYLLLGAIIQRVTEMSLGEYLKKHIFEPLGMKNTFVYGGRMELPEERAHGHIHDVTSGYRVKPDIIMSGAGGVNSTVEDLFLWNQIFCDNRDSSFRPGSVSEIA
jgi:CubicO group peptidase (beta-lactamase class C family)